MEECYKGLACPLFDEAAIDANISLDGGDFFDGIDELMAPIVHHGKGKEMKLLLSLYKPHEDADTTDIYSKTELENNKVSFGASKVSTGLDRDSLQLKFDSTKKRLRDNYDQIAREKKQREIQVISLLELPKINDQKVINNGKIQRCRHHFTQTFKKSRFAAAAAACH